MTHEIWKDIAKYEGRYQVSNRGRIKSIKRRYVHKDKIISPVVCKRGYAKASLCKNGERKPHTIHRLVAIAFIKNPKNKPGVNHRNGIKTDNGSENLEWATGLENSRHAANAGLYYNVTGERNHNAKLNEFQVRVIRKCPDLYQRELAKIFNVSRGVVDGILQRRRWKHV